MSIMKRFLIPFVIAVGVLLSITPFYSFAYIIFIAVSIRYLPTLKTFHTTLSKAFLALLLLVASISMVGTITWLLSIENYPILNIVGYAAIVLLVAKSRKEDRSKSPLLDRIDLTALLVAIVPIVILLCSFFFMTPNKPAALMQLASEGWDNGSHVMMLENSSLLNSYNYRPTENINNVTLTGNAYPQAWHLSSASIANGFGGNQFIASKPMHTTLVYMVVSLVWFIITVYLLALLSYRFYEISVRKNQRNHTVQASIIAVLSLTIMVVVISALMHGFTNYLGSLAYLIAFCAIVYDTILQPKSNLYALAIIMAALVSLMWFLTAPAVILTVLFLLLTRYKSLGANINALIRDKAILISSVVSGLVILMQVLAFQIYSPIGSTGQLVDGSRITPFDMTGSPMHISIVLFGVMIALTVWYMVKARTTDSTKRFIIATTLPWIILTLSVYLYQNIMEGYNSYYLTKVMGLCIAVLTIPTAIIFAEFFSKISVPYKKMVAPILSISAVVLLVLASGQPTYGLNKLFQRHMRTTYGTAEQIVKYLPETTDGKAYIVVLTDRKSYENSREDNHGKYEMRVVNQPPTCTYLITTYNSTKSKLKNLEECAKDPSMKSKTIYVITTKEIYSRVETLNLPNVIPIKT